MTGNKHDRHAKGTKTAAGSLDQHLIDQVFSLGEGENVPMLEPPAGLREKLYAIPERQVRRKSSAWRWLCGGGAIAASVLAALLFMPTHQVIPEQLASAPTQADIANAEQQVLVAFAYLENANQEAAKTLQRTVNESLEKAAVDPVLDVFNRLNRDS